MNHRHEGNWESKEQFPYAMGTQLRNTDALVYQTAIFTLKSSSRRHELVVYPINNAIIWL